MEEKEDRERLEALHTELGQIASQLAELFKLLLSLAVSLYIGGWIHAGIYFLVFGNSWLAGQVPVNSLPVRVLIPVIIFITVSLTAASIRHRYWVKNPVQDERIYFKDAG